VFGRDVLRQRQRGSLPWLCPLEKKRATMDLFPEYLFANFLKTIGSHCGILHSTVAADISELSDLCWTTMGQFAL
jgi:hypothetical protein